MKWKIFSATRIGYHHHDNFQNNQDAFIHGVTSTGISFVFVLDGCGSGKFSEIARLLAHFLAQTIEDLSNSNELRQLPDLLWEELFKYYKGLAKLHKININSRSEHEREKAKNFVWNYLLHTVLGILANSEDTLILTRGDGKFGVNGEVTEINKDNRPDYPAYLLVPWESLESHYLIPGFDIYLNKSKDVESAFVATDGAIKLLIERLLSEYHEFEDSGHLLMMMNRVFDFEKPYHDEATIGLLVKEE